MKIFCHYSTLLFVSFVLLLLTESRSLTAPSTNGRRFKRIYAFGDSFTDTGNTNASTGPYGFTFASSLPYGTTFFHRPTNRYSDGRLVIDFIATSLSLPFLPPYLHSSNATDRYVNGVNFAVAGSTAIEHEFFVKNNATLDVTPQSLGTQLQWFEEYMVRNGCPNSSLSEKDPACQSLLKDALFWIGEIGANDYAYTLATGVSITAVRRLSVNKVSETVEGLLKRGARYMVVQGLPMIGCLPLTLILTPTTDRDELGCSFQSNNQTVIHNSLLQSKLRQLRNQYPDAIITYFDYYMAHHEMIKNAANYGLTETLKACCGSSDSPYNFDLFKPCGVSPACNDPSKYVNWDGAHLTEAAYKVTTKLFLQPGYSRPSFGFLLNHKLRNG